MAVPTRKDAAVHMTFSSTPSFAGANWYIVGGTSAGSPQWASIFVLVNQQRVLNSKEPIGFANSALYGLSAGQKAADFHDITVGGNRLVGTYVGFNAVVGYDLVTGWGKPNVANLVADLSCTQAKARRLQPPLPKLWLRSPSWAERSPLEGLGPRIRAK